MGSKLLCIGSKHLVMRGTDQQIFPIYFRLTDILILLYLPLLKNEVLVLVAEVSRK
jgi:hypothetical protein